MNNKRAKVKKLYQIASIGFYIAALGFFAAALIGNNLTYSPIGAVFMCIGMLFFVLSKKKDKNADNDTNEKE